LTFDGTTLLVNSRIDVGVNAEYFFRVNPTTSLTSNYEYFGETLKLGGNGTQGSMYVFDTSGGGWTLTDSDSVATTAGLLGWNVAGGNDYLIRGYIKDTSWSWTAGAILFVGNITAGKIISAQPTGSGQVSRIVGFALSSDEIFFDPSQDWITIA
jgi:hypothetical protein